MYRRGMSMTNMSSQGMLEGPRESGADRQVTQSRPNNARSFFPDMVSVAMFVVLPNTTATER